VAASRAARRLGPPTRHPPLTAGAERACGRRSQPPPAPAGGSGPSERAGGGPSRHLLLPAGAARLIIAPVDQLASMEIGPSIPAETPVPGKLRTLRRASRFDGADPAELCPPRGRFSARSVAGWRGTRGGVERGAGWRGAPGGAECGAGWRGAPGGAECRVARSAGWRGMPGGAECRVARNAGRGGAERRVARTRGGVARSSAAKR
jgi:hypothetical protein